jgi:hypothetical protein
MRIYQAITALLMILSLSACGAPFQPTTSLSQELTGSGKVVTQAVSLSDFDVLEVNGNMQVEVLPGDHYAVSVSADDNLIQHVSITQRGRQLILGLSPAVKYHSVSGSLKAIVTLPRLSGVTANGNSEVRLDALRGDNIQITTSGNSEVRGALAANSARVVASGNSYIALTGSTPDLQVNGSGNVLVDLSRLAAGNAHATLTGLAQATVNVQNRLDYRLSGLGHLTYMGHPRIGDCRISGSAQVSQD